MTYFHRYRTRCTPTPISPSQSYSIICSKSQSTRRTTLPLPSHMLFACQSIPIYRIYWLGVSPLGKPRCIEPSQDIVSLQSSIVGVNHPCIAPPTCKAYPIALLLHDHCAIYVSPLTLLFYAIHHTILMMATSCKG